MIFPKWNPQKTTNRKINSNDFNTKYKALRYSSSGFIKRQDVRDIIFNRDKKRCIICGSGNDLQIDHIVSIWRTAKGKFPIELLNTKENLQIICKTCNSRKLP